MKFRKFPENLGIFKDRTKGKKDSIEMAYNAEESFTKVPISDSILRKYLQEDLSHFSKVLHNYSKRHQSQKLSLRPSQLLSIWFFS